MSNNISEKLIQILKDSAIYANESISLEDVYLLRCRELVKSGETNWQQVNEFFDAQHSKI